MGGVAGEDAFRPVYCSGSPLCEGGGGDHDDDAGRAPFSGWGPVAVELYNFGFSGAGGDERFTGSFCSPIMDLVDINMNSQAAIQR